MARPVRSAKRTALQAFNPTPTLLYSWAFPSKGCGKEAEALAASNGWVCCAERLCIRHSTEAGSSFSHPSPAPVTEGRHSESNS